ncbi:YqiA/YcfP family alpha/beta fold hydrolase [Bizionia hallyeonensis]|uniref:YqiA/YcfP family alpha/beta fold hydrolase n=1 Tax=Bizionia hallyeonensis TaxID=1123757 RepID=A0ABW0C0J3_9FLAO
MNILYIHGLNGSLSPEKREILEEYGEVHSPFIDYEVIPDSITKLSASYHNRKIDVIIGSSMGGFAGYYVSNVCQCPALLFNPALAERSVYQNVPNIQYKKSPFKQIVIGTQDNVVNPKRTLNFLANTLDKHPNYQVNVYNDLAHRIPVNIFEKEVKLFFKQLCD